MMKKICLCTLFLLGCQAPGAFTPSETSQSVQAPRSTTENTSFAAFQEQLFRIQAIPTDAVRLALKASEGNLSSPIIKLLILDSEGLSGGFLNPVYTQMHSVAFKLPVGSDYLIQVEARNANDQAIARGQIRADVSNGSVIAPTLTLVPVPVNQPPQIQAVNATPPNLAGPGHTAQLSCQAQDPNGDALSYSWSTVGGNFGSFSGTTGSQVNWTAPAAVGSYTIRCSVSDGTHTVNQDLSLTVASPATTIIGNIGP